MGNQRGRQQNKTLPTNCHPSKLFWNFLSPLLLDRSFICLRTRNGGRGKVRGYFHTDCQPHQPCMLCRPLEPRQNEWHTFEIFAHNRVKFCLKNKAWQVEKFGTFLIVIQLIQRLLGQKSAPKQCRNLPFTTLGRLTNPPLPQLIWAT